METEKGKINCIDLLKLLMAILVVGIHTETFGFNMWLDRGFGIITRLCVPFFFVTSGYFFWIKETAHINIYLRRLLMLYIIWSVVYSPFDVDFLSSATPMEIISRYLWFGNEHALWYLCGSIIGFIITYSLLKIFKPNIVLIIGICFLVMGCIKSTWEPMFEHLLHVELNDILGSRNGLFYAFPYISLGMAIAKSKNKGKTKNIKLLVSCLIISLFMLVVESLLFVIVFHTTSTILWLSVFPCSYFVFLLGNNIYVKIKKETSVTLRKISTLVYVSQYLFIPFYKNYVDNIVLFTITTLTTIIFSIIIINLSNLRKMKFLKHLY